LIIKVASTGDVLRTNGLIKALKKKYPYSHITWITAEDALPLFENLDLVDNSMPVNSNLTILTLQTTQFDLAINLDTDLISSMLMTQANAVQKLGYGYSKHGYIYPCNPEAEYWFQMGLSDNLKKANTMTYQQIMFEICQLVASVSAKPLLKKSENENRLTQQFRNRHGIRKDHLVVGLNTGAGKRWPLKKWTIENFIALINRINQSKYNTRIILYGGPAEKERNAKIKKNVSSTLIDSGCGNSIREEIALLDASDILVTGDTLVMHMGIALDKYILLLLGPTSFHEIDLFGNGQKIVSDLPCLCCYKDDCNMAENCMNCISVDTVFDHIAAYLESSVCSKS
jgi:heptosyltransferase-2